MKFVLRASCLVLCVAAFAAVASSDSRAAKLKRLYESDDRNYVFVAAHRCDWLTHPENALSAVEGAIAKGVDILEIDAQRTKDGRFVVSHDGSVDRCTEGTGGIGSKTLAELTRLRLRDRNGGKDNPLTDERLPSLEDVLRAAKGRALVNIDRSQNWPEELAAVVRRLGMEDEVIFKSALDLSGTRGKFASAWDGATVGGGPIEFMPILWCYNPTNRANVALADEWLALTRPPRCYEICFGNDALAENVFRRLLAHPSHPRIWVNVMWGSLCAGHHDGKGGEGWDWSVDHGATILQTDHIENLVRHLESRGRHDLDAALANVELSLDLAGEWTVEGKDLSGRLHLPGTLADAKLGRPFTAEDWAKAGDQRVKGALSRAYQYTGPATYAREVELPSAPKNYTYEIFLERVMWSCEVFFDGVSLGTCDSLGTPHVHAIPAALATPGKHEIRLAIDNSNIYGLTRWAHSYGEVMQSIWHGVVGKMCIRRVSRLAKARVFAPDPRERRLELELPVGLPEPMLEAPDLGLSLVGEKPSPYRKGAVLRTYALKDEPTAWTPETPNLHRLVVTLPDGDRRVFRVGFRTVTTRGKEFLLNGRPFFLRGNVECCNFPLTGHPAMDVASWRRIFKAHRADGFNAVRFHSWLPPAAAYEAADEIGIFLMPEANIWHDGWMGAADRLPGAGSSTDGFIRRELAAALEAYGNHPSFFSLAIGNELSMGEPRLGVMNGWMQESKASDPRHLYTISGGRGYVTADGKDCDDFSACGWIPAPGNGFARGAYNNSGPFPLGTMEDFEAAYSHALIPHVRHELGQWVVYPVRSELDKFTGTLRPYDREEFVRRMDKAGLSGFERRFHDVSCRLQDLAYRESIESYLRTPSCAGYQMLEAQDFSGQGEALVGWRDSFYDLKPGYGDRKPFIASVTGVVALVRFPNRCLRVGDTLKVRLQLRNLTAETVSAGTSFRWSFAGRSGVAKLADALPPNGLGEAGTVEIALDETLAGMRHEFVFADRRWPIWVFADEQPLARPEGVVFTDDRDVALETLRTGGRVVFTGPTRHGGRANYRPVFWSAATLAAEKFPLLGSIVDAASPLFKGGFPSEDWADLHWNLLLDGTRIHLVDGLSADFTPIVRGIPDFHNPKSASPLFELAVGRGRLLVCGIALDGNEPERVAFRNALFRYVASDAFAPKTEASEGWLAARLMTDSPKAVDSSKDFSDVPAYIAPSLGEGGGAGDLAGEWTVEGTNFCGRLHLPGTLADAKLGRPMTAEDWRTTTDRAQLGALMRAYQYTGPATYAREVVLPPSPSPSPLEIFLERVMWKSTIRWDGKDLGTCDSLSTPHVHAIPAALATPGRHRLEIVVDNSRFYDFSGWSHSYGPVMQSVWHGILGRMEIRPAHPLAGVRVFPSPVAERKVAVEVPQDFHAVLGETIRLEGLKATSLVEAPSPYRADRKFVTVSLGETPVEWNEFHPTLYTLAVGDARVRFGFRQIATRGRELMLNGQSFFMRGNLDCCNFPLTGAPDMSVEGWRRIFTRLDAQGINTVRFHSWCPPEAAFVAADELGLYLAVEAAIWVDGWMKTDPVGHGKPIDGFTQRELKAILDAYGNHPSFISLGIGNELSDSEFTTMGDWLNACKKDDPRRLYFASTARKISPGDDYLVTHAYPGIGGVRCWFYPNNDWDYEKAYSRCDIPCVAHEIGQWPVYPDWGELKKYTGVLRPYNLEALYAKAVSNDTLRFNREYAFASARLNRLMYRDEVESFFRTRSCSGFQLLGVQDFSGQFEALVGWLDSFYDVKPAVRELPPFSKVSNALPHLARFGKYVWQEGETFEARLLVRNLTDAEIPAGRAFAWSSGTHGGTFRLAAPLAVGDLAELGTVRFPLVVADGARRTLRFGENEWTFWVFPKRTACAVPENVVMTADYEEMVAALKKGARVVYVGDSNGMGSGKFKPVYWSTGFFPWGGDTATLGTWIDAAHPALAGFPTEDWADWQWQSLADGARIHRLAGLPAGYRPVVMPVPDLHFSTFLGSVFELAVGEGRLLVCGYAIENPKDIAAIALRNSILAYAAGDGFHPSAKTDFAWLADRFRPAWRDRLAPRPGEFAEAPVYIECAVGQSANGDSRWMRGNDRAEFARGTYQFDGRGFGTWKDTSGTYWYGRRIDLTLKDIQPTAGELRVRFRDPNRNGRTGRGTFEGAPFDIPKHQDNPDGAYWLTLPLLREQALDGRLEFSCEALSGPNLMIDRIVIVPAPDAAAARPNLVFGVISDIHVKQRGWEDKGWDATYFHRALEWFRDQGVDGVVIAGDLADNGRADQLEAIAEAWFDVFPKGCGVEKLFVSGNHDWWGQKSVEKMDALWTRVWGEKYESVWMKRVKGYAFVGCHWEEYGSCYGAPFPKLEPFLAAHGADLGTEKPFFCIQHAHPKNTCYGSWAWGYDSGDTTRLLAPFPNAVVFSGHSHYPLTDERSIWQGAFTSIGTGSLRYMSRPDENRKGPGFENGWKGDAKVMAACAVDDVKNGMLVRVYDDEIVYERRDFQYGRKLGEDWVQPIGKRTALDFNRRRAAEPPAEFAPDARLVASRMRAKPRKGEEVPALEVVIPPANAGKTRPFGYELRVTGTNGVQRTVQVLAEGYGQPLEDARAQGAMKARISIDGLETGALEVEVLPFTSWEYDIDCNYGRPLRLKVED